MAIVETETGSINLRHPDADHPRNPYRKGVCKACQVWQHDTCGNKRGYVDSCPCCRYTKESELDECT